MRPNDLFRPLRSIYMPNEHAVNTARLFEKLDAAFVKAEGTVVDDTVVSLVVDGDAVTGAVLGDGRTIGAKHVVVAAGAASLDLLESLPEVRRRISPMVSGYGVPALVRTKDRSLPRSVIRTPNRALACGLHCVPRGVTACCTSVRRTSSPTPRANSPTCGT
jgi:glycine/D-amino acid oxidase-like deaminating enzyme